MRFVVFAFVFALLTGCYGGPKVGDCVALTTRGELEPVLVYKVGKHGFWIERSDRSRAYIVFRAEYKLIDCIYEGEENK